MQLLVFDPALGGESDAEKKILFFHPQCTPLPEQVNLVGLCEAVVNFMGVFDKQGPFEALHTSQRRHLFFRPEPAIWVVLIVENGADAVAADAAISEDEEWGEVAVEEEAMEDEAARSLLLRIWELVHLCCGPMQAHVHASGVDILRKMLGDVVPMAIELFALSGQDDPSKYDLVDVLNGLRFMPVSRLQHLRVLSSMNAILTAHANIPHAMLLYNDQLVWSSLTRKATMQDLAAISTRD